MSEIVEKEEIKTEGYYVLRDPGGTLHDVSQGKTLSGKAPQHLKLTKMVRKALAAGAIVEITKAKFEKLLKELGMEVKKGEVITTLDALTDKQNNVLNGALKAEILIKRGNSYYLDDKKVATGEGGLIKKLKDKKFFGKLATDLAGIENAETGSKPEGKKGSVDTPADMLLEAVDAGVVKQEEGVYMFGEFALGTSDEEAVAFLANKANVDIAETLKKELTEKGA